MKTFTSLLFIAFIFPYLFSQEENLALDLTFGQNGILELNEYSSANQILVDSNQNFYVLSYVSPVQNILKFLPDGELDESFGSNGGLYLSNWVNKIYLDENYLYVLSSESENDNTYFNLLSRYDHNGIPDLSFGEEGIFEDISNLSYRPIQVIDYQDGLLFILSKSGMVKFMKLTLDGQLDFTFGTSGIIEKPQFVDTHMGAVPIDYIFNDNAIYTVANDGTNKFYTLKYNSEFENDQEYGINGRKDFEVYGNGPYDAGSFFLTDNSIYISGNGYQSGPPYNSRYAFVKKLNKITGVQENSEGYGYGDPGFMHDTYYYGGFTSLLFQGDKMIIGGRGEQSEYGEYTRFYMTKFPEETTIFKEFNFLAEYKSFAQQGENKLLAAGHANGHFFISRHHLSENMNVDEISSQSILNIFPNPAFDFFQISSNKKVKELKIYQLDGKQIKSFKADTKYNIKELNSGIYLIKVQFLDNITLTKKLVVK